MPEQQYLKHKDLEGHLLHLLTVLSQAWAGYSGRSWDLEPDLQPGRTVQLQVLGRWPVWQAEHSSWRIWQYIELLMQPGTWNQEAAVKQWKFTQCEITAWCHGIQKQKVLQHSGRQHQRASSESVEPQSACGAGAGPWGSERGGVRLSLLCP